MGSWRGARLPRDPASACVLPQRVASVAPKPLARPVAPKAKARPSKAPLATVADLKKGVPGAVGARAKPLGSMAGLDAQIESVPWKRRSRNRMTAGPLVHGEK